MNPHETKFERHVSETIGKAYRKAADAVAEGVSVDKYREEVGYLRGLKAALDIVSKARAELEKNEGNRRQMQA